MRAQESHGHPGHDEQQRPSQCGAQPVRDRLDPGRLDQGDGQLVADQQHTHNKRAQQQVIVENVLEQGMAQRRVALRRGVRHTITLPSLPAASCHCWTYASRIAHRARRHTSRQPEPHGATSGIPHHVGYARERLPLQYVHVPPWSRQIALGLPRVSVDAAGYSRVTAALHMSTYGYKGTGRT